MNTKTTTLLAAALLVGLLPAAGAGQTVTLPKRDRVLAGTPTTLYTVGRAEGEDWEMFAGITSLAFDDDEQLYVLDQQAQRVLVFDAHGRFVRQIGRRGGGPGELQAAFAVAVTTGGAVVVSDLGRRAFVVYDRGGTFRRNVPFAEGTLGSGALQAHPSGGVLSAPRRMSVGGSPAEIRASAAAPETQPILLQALDADDAARVIVDVPVPSSRISTQSTSAGTRVMMGPPPMFSPTLRWTGVGDGTVAVAHEAGYSIRIHDVDGRVRRSITRDIPPRRVSNRDREEARALRRRQLESGQGMAIIAGGGGGGGAPTRPSVVPEAVLRSQIDQMEFAETIPVIRALRTAADGRIWVARQEKVDASRDPIDIISASGEYVGTVVGQQLPAAFSARGRAAYIDIDELGVPRVRVVRLPESWR
jgi:hypothetical protein